jgi:hypothetical protein
MGSDGAAAAEAGAAWFGKGSDPDSGGDGARNKAVREEADA